MLRTMLTHGALLGAALCFVPQAQAQTIYGVDGSATTLWEFTTTAGGPCTAPNSIRVGCGYSVPICPGLPPPGPFMPPPTGRLGDVATNGIADTVFVTDGFIIEEYVGDSPCGVPPPCTPVNAFPAPSFLGPLTGMGMDALGATFGVPTLWLTDGIGIAAVTPSPPGSCVPPAPLFGPCVVGLPAGSGLLLDVTWDPSTGTLWASDSLGLIHNISIALCAATVSYALPPTCGFVGVPLHGIAFDKGTPNVVTGAPAALYVTDGARVAYIDAATGAPAAPSFYTPVMCTPTNGPISGLAQALHGITYGTPRVAATVGSFGQSSTPGPTFGVEVTGSPAGTTPYLVLNFNFPGPGFFCPPLGGVGTLFWVDPGGAAIVVLPALPAGCVPIPLPLGALIPTGLQGFIQFVFLPVGGPPAADATEGLEFTIGTP